MEKLIKELKKEDSFEFNQRSYIVKQKLSDWKKDGDPYLLTYCGELFFSPELEVTRNNNPKQTKQKRT